MSRAMKNRNTELVYSTAQGRMCPDCGLPREQCICKQNRPVANSDGVVRVSRETKGRKGKSVTLITGLPLNEIELKFLAKELKVKCGSGGTVKNGVIEIQGDHRDRMVDELQKKGWLIKRVGG